MGEDLARRLIERSEIHGEFVLSSGRTSTAYFDKFRFLTDPVLLDELADAVVALLPDGLTLLASPEGAATLLLAPVAMRAGLPMAVVRKARKEYGTRVQVEGVVEAGARVGLIEDVSTTGGQTLKAAKALEEEGAEIVRIVLTIDRGGADPLRAEGYEVDAVASLRPKE
ncbi:MAG: phosphoribosyltransferase family protein [Actinomycetota bacterium]